MKSLVGYTGFVGSNLAGQNAFDFMYNTRNIETSYGTRPDLLVYAGVRAEKYLANRDPEKDYENIKAAINNIKAIDPRRLVLISTVDVYKKPAGCDEDSVMETDGLSAYGLNRYRLEQWAENSISDHLIVRLPGLYGKNIKKNFIYDMIHIIPSQLTEAKMAELSAKDGRIRRYYNQQDNGFYKCRELTEEETELLKECFRGTGFSALNFTDSRSSFQFYNLSFLWEHICLALSHGIRRLNLATEPVTAAELYQYVRGAGFRNEISASPANYDFRTKYDAVFGGKNGYIFDKNAVMKDVGKFVRAKN